MYGLILSVVVEIDIALKDIKELYQDDLPVLINEEEEFFRWKRRWESVSKNDRPSTIASSLYVLLRICATTRVTSCEWERSGSVLKGLHTYLRASMGQTQLSVTYQLRCEY